MKRAFVLTTVVGLASTLTAQEITPGTTADLLGEANNLFAATNLVTVNSATIVADAVTNECFGGGTPEEVQFGVARGFLGANGFVIANAWVDNQDESVPPSPMVDDPFGCANFEGTVGGIPQATLCDGTDALLTSTLLDVGGGPVTTEDGVVYTIDFDVAVDTTIDISYNFMTFENPTDTAFYDSWGVFLDGVLIAGGTTNGVPPAGTDAWSLSPSPSVPSEFNSQPVNGFFITPAQTTGLRTIEAAVTMGNHTLSFHVADGGNGIAEPSCNASADNVVDSALFVGLETYQSGNVGAVTPGRDIGRSGHTVVTGGPFGDDLQVTLGGAPAGTVLVLAQSPVAVPGFTIPLLAPNEILIGLSPLQILTTQVASGSGTDVYPPVPPSIPTNVTGRFHYQWWILNAGSFENTKGLAMTFQ